MSESVRPAPTLPVTSDTRLIHLSAWEWAKVAGLRVARVSVTQEGEYNGPIVRSW